jgi:hypothetical protein
MDFMQDRSSNNMNRNWRDLIGGILLVLASHIGFWLLTFAAFSTIFRAGNSIGTLIGSALLTANFILGITQLTYLIPIARYFRRRQRSAVIKGIAVGAVITILLNGSCYIWASLDFGGGPYHFIGTAIITLIIAAMAYSLINEAATK